MKTTDFLDLIKDTLDSESSITLNDNIEDIEEWDSLGVLSLVGMLDDLGIVFEIEKFEDIKTIRDFVHLIDIIDD
jgi:acyl carrier protein